MIGRHREPDAELDRRLSVLDGYLDRSFTADLDDEARTEIFRQKVVRQAAALHSRHTSVAPYALATGTAGPLRVGDGLDEPVAAAVEGDPQAVERLLAAIRPLVVRYCRARVGRQERSFAS
ncbi:hypothetical protein Q5425_30105, partial [Amycolatopsis sp. A133]|nr:hypothetical protein [Amycolatopsis sp. A133]